MPEDLIDIKKNKSESSAICCPDNKVTPAKETRVNKMYGDDNVK